MGTPATFVRLSECNLRCVYCDTKYAFEKRKKLSLAEILCQVRAMKNTLVICTGGEPLLQENRSLPLILSQEGYRVVIETNGAVALYRAEEISDDIRKNLHYVVDIKCPCSNMEKSDILEQNADLLTDGDEIKCVVADREDVLFSFQKIDKIKRTICDKKINIILSPVFGKMDLKELAEYVLTNQTLVENTMLTLKMGIQLHKYIWPDIDRGV